MGDNSFRLFAGECAARLCVDTEGSHAEVLEVEFVPSVGSSESFAAVPWGVFWNAERMSATTGSSMPAWMESCG